MAVRARRTDANQREVVALLRDFGAVVYIIQEPCDLLVGYRSAWCLVEVKTEKGKATKQQKALAETCHAAGLPFYEVREGEPVSWILERLEKHAAGLKVPLRHRR